MTPGGTADVALIQEIHALEARRVAAMVARDIPTLEALLADDLSYTHSGGMTDTKASFLRHLIEKGSRYRYLGIAFSGTEVLPLNAATAVVRGRAEIRLEEVAPYLVLFLDVWAHRNGQWQMVAWQATRVNE
jgi:hypothetical protein